MAGTLDDARPGATGARAAHLRYVPHLRVVVECDRPLAGGACWPLDGVEEVRVGRGEARAAERRPGVLDVRIPSRKMSERHARLVRGGSSWVLQDTDSRNGCFVDGARVSSAVLGAGELFELGGVFLRIQHAPLPKEVTRVPDAPEPPTFHEEFAAQMASLDVLATSPVPVLLLGESGTGKEVLARRIHRHSLRRGELVAVNCGALPSGLVESLLFGHAKGAFSGAVRDELGFVRAAHGGTLFLDEVGDLPKGAQATLLRVLQERATVPIGATRPVGVDFKIVAATHRSLDRDVDSGEFRPDLYARLAGFVVRLPPLRERPDDLGVLIAALLKAAPPEAMRSVSFSPDVVRAFLAYEWPSNVRELEHCLTVSVALARGGRVEMEHLPASIRHRVPSGTRPSASGELASSRDERLRRQLLAELTRHRGNLADVARAMGKARMQVHRWCKRYGVDPNAFRSPQ